LVGARVENTSRNEPKQRALKDESRKRIRRTHAQRKSNQGVLGVISGLNRVVPLVEHLDYWANNAGEQD